MKILPKGNVWPSLSPRIFKEACIIIDYDGQPDCNISYEYISNFNHLPTFQPRSVAALEQAIEVLNEQYQACEVAKYDSAALSDANTPEPTKQTFLVPLWFQSSTIYVPNFRCNLWVTLAINHQIRWTNSSECPVFWIFDINKHRTAKWLILATYSKLSRGHTNKCWIGDIWKTTWKICFWIKNNLPTMMRPRLRSKITAQIRTTTAACLGLIRTSIVPWLWEEFCGGFGCLELAIPMAHAHGPRCTKVTTTEVGAKTFSWISG